MNKICTSIEQSQILIELGIDVNTADMRYGYIAPYDFSDRMYDGGYDEVPYLKDFLLKNPNFSANEYDGELPTWSLTALIKLIPFQIITKNERYGFRQLKGYNTQGETYYFEYISSINQRLYETYHWNNPLDAAFEMVCWLKKEEYI